jgi:hypothetical protein
MSDNYPHIFVCDSRYLFDTSDIKLKYTLLGETDSTDLITKINQKFADGGVCGGYAPMGVHPVQSTLHYSGEEKKSKSNIAIYYLKSAAIDVNCFQILRNMASRLSLDGLFIKNIEVELPDNQQIGRFELPVPDENNEEKVYPSRSAKNNFSILWEDSDFSKSRRVLVEMVDRPGSDMASALSLYVKSWYTLLEGGGFAMPVGLPNETESTTGRVIQFDESSFEISVSRFQASEMAWNVLINIIASYSEKVSSVDRIIID